MASKKIRIGIFGSNFGKVGLAPTFTSIKGCEVLHINSKENWKEIIDGGGLDAVALAVPPSVQYEIAKFATKKGVNVFAEKPLTANLKQAEELLALTKKHKTITAVDFLFPEIPEWRKIKQILDHKTYGKLKHITVNWDWLSGDIKYKKKTWKTSIEDGGGVLSFYFSHGFYYLENFAGKISKIKTKFTHSKESLNGAEVGADMQIQFKNGVTGDAHISCNNKDIVRHQLVFECEKGIIILEAKNSIVNNFTITTITNGKVKIIKAKKITKSKKDERVRIVKILAKRFVDSIRSKKQMSPSFREGLRVQELIEMARKGKI